MTENTGSQRGGTVAFTIDGQEYHTEERRLRAEEILALAGLDAARFDLGEVRGAPKPKTKRYQDCETVRIRRGSRFVSIRQCADVA